MKKILAYLRENLEITTREARSTLAFLAAALFCTGIYITASFLTRSQHIRYTIEQYAAEAPPDREEAPSPAQKKEKFRFDPNTASLEQLTRLGIPARTAATILNYRSKGGKFRHKEDLQKIYSLKPEVYTELESWISLPVKADTGARKKQEKYDTGKARAEKAPPFDINTADTTALKNLRGIGSVLASRIIRFRDALGGFHSPEQLDETYGIPPDVLATLKKAVVIGSPVSRIPVNEAENLRHPYLKAHQAKAILLYRRQHGPFRSVEDLRQIRLLDEETIRKIEPYLSF